MSKGRRNFSAKGRGKAGKASFKRKGGARSDPWEGDRELDKMAGLRRGGHRQ